MRQYFNVDFTCLLGTAHSSMTITANLLHDASIEFMASFSNDTQRVQSILNTYTAGCGSWLQAERGECTNPLVQVMDLIHHCAFM